MRLLGARERSAAELRERLSRKGFPPEEIVAALGRAGELGYLDDARAARATLERLLARGAGRALIAQRLELAGTPRPLLEAALAGLPPERALAEGALRRRFGESPPPAPKAARYLAGRGFADELVAELTAELPELGSA